MRAFGFVIVTLLLILTGWNTPALAAPQDDPPPHLRMTLAAETPTPRVGDTVTLAIDIRPQPGWHGYWTNPGDAGFPATFDWKLPPGATVSAPAYPAPQRLIVAGLMNYVYERPYALVARLTLPGGLASGAAVPVRLHMDYLVCTASLCVPEKADLAIDLTIGDGAIDPATRARFDGWRRALPQPLGAMATYQASGKDVRIAIPYPAGAGATDAYFYPLTAGAIDYAAPQTVTRDGDRLVIATKATGAKGDLAGVLSVAGRALAVTARPGTVAASGGGVAAAGAGAAGWGWSALIAFAGAVLGGLILNVMPCVFPILSLKALSLARAGGEGQAARREALAYTGGVIAVCLLLGATILALRAGGSAVGWAFQLQNPRVVLVLLLLGVGIALNLSGLFEFATPRFVDRAGAGGAFMTGALAAFVATPCTGPFMGAALGAALVLPWPAALAVFVGLGLGLALPFLLLGFVPRLRRLLPRPGAWMETFRRILSVPMWLTALALAWVLGRQAGVDGMTIGLAAALIVGFLLWWGGRRQARGRGFGWALAVAIVCVAAFADGQIGHAPARAAAPATTGAAPFSEATLTRLRGEGRPVFAYFTADWCLTCKVNERAAIETDGVRQAFARNNVAVLVGDWTNGDPVLGRFIEAHNRAGVPLYLYYPKGGGEPQVLPQVLTPAMLESLK